MFNSISNISLPNKHKHHQLFSFQTNLHQILSSQSQNFNNMTMENQMSSPYSSTSNPPMHKNPHTISKTKPKIRIIHIFAPEIIKTDAANFRELVQRLTGKPTVADSNRDGERVPSRKKEARIFSPSKKMEMAGRAGFHAEFRERVKEEGEEIWMSANSGGGFLGGFAEFDGFMQEINQCPFSETHQVQDAYEECQIV